MREKSHYQILGVPPAATHQEIKEAYRAIARKYHPDVAEPGCDFEFAEVATAYAVLEDERSRKRYDSLISLTMDKCLTCEGLGVNYKQKGFTIRIPYTCSACAGAGYFPRKRK